MGFVSPCSSAPTSIIYFLTSINIYLIKKSTNQNTAGDKTESDIKRLRAIQKLEKIMKTPVKCEVGEMNLYKNCKKKERRVIFFKTFFFFACIFDAKGKKSLGSFKRNWLVPKENQWNASVQEGAQNVMHWEYCFRIPQNLYYYVR